MLREYRVLGEAGEAYEEGSQLNIAPILSDYDQKEKKEWVVLWEC